MGIEKIYEFLEHTGMTKKDFAHMCRLNADAFYTALKNNKIGPLTADKIDKFTKGKVRYEDLTDKKRPRKASRRKKPEWL